MPQRPTSPGSPAQSTGSGFGRRAADKRPGAKFEPRLDRTTPIEFMRSVAADVIRKWECASPGEQAQYFIQIRTIQDQISGMLLRNAALTMKSSPLSWVDLWSPP